MFLQQQGKWLEAQPFGLQCKWLEQMLNDSPKPSWPLYLPISTYITVPLISRGLADCLHDMPLPESSWSIKWNFPSALSLSICWGSDYENNYIGKDLLEIQKQVWPCSANLVVLLIWNLKFRNCPDTFPVLFNNVEYGVEVRVVVLTVVALVVPAIVVFSLSQASE